MHRTTARHRAWKFLAALLVGLVVLAGCGDDDETTGGDTTETTAKADEQSILGEENKATGAPIKLGLVSDGKSDHIDNTSEIEAAKAAVEYVNDYLGGLNGHVIELVVCETKQVPATATDCGSQMVDDGVVATLVGVSGQTGSIIAGLEGSGVPFFSYANIDRDALTKPGNFVMTNGMAAIAGPAVVAQDAGIKNAGVIVSDVPAATGPVNSVGKIFYGNAGVELTIVPVPPSVADPTPMIQSAISAGAKQFGIIGNPALCTQSIKAMKTLGFDGPVVLIPQCIDNESGASIPGGYEGMTLLTSTVDDAEDEEFQVYEAVMAKYAKGVNTGGVAPGGYIAVVGFARALEGLAGEITTASITAHLSAMPEAKAVPLGGGITFQCGTKPVAITPNICAAKSLQATLDKDGKGHDYKPIDTSAITKLG